MSVDLFRNKPTKFISTVPHSKLFHFWVNTFFINKNLSSELTHRIRDWPSQDQEEVKPKRSRPIPRNHTYSKNLESFSRMANCFAPLSMPDLKANLSEKDLLALAFSSGNSSDDSGLNGNDDASPSCRIWCGYQKSRLTKRQKTTVTGSRGTFQSRSWCHDQVKTRRLLRRIVHVGRGERKIVM